MSERIDALTEWIRDITAPASKLLIPVSGGTDSALCFWLCRQAAPDKAVAVHAGKQLQSQEWFERVGPVEFVDVPGEHFQREEMRWAAFLSKSRERSAWLIGSRNRTEDLLGTYSMASRVAPVLPLVGTWKSAVLEMCLEIKVPAEMIVSSLRADPDCGRPMELSEIPYEHIERFLKVRVGEVRSDELEALTEEQISYLDGIYRHNAFKGKLPTRGPSVCICRQIPRA